jgi:hypothetical protein
MHMKIFIEEAEEREKNKECNNRRVKESTRLNDALIFSGYK